MPRIALWIALTGIAGGLSSACGDIDEGSIPDAPADRSDAVGDAGDGSGTDSAPEADADTAGDAPVDAAPDAGHDSSADAVPETDAPGEVGPDAEPDAEPDATDDVGIDGHDARPDAWAELTLTLTEASAFVNMMPGGPPAGIVYFTVQVENTGTAAATGFHSPLAEVNASAGGATFFSTTPSLTLSGGGTFDGSIGTGDTVILDGYGRVEDSGTGAACGQEAKVSISFAWDGTPAVSRSGEVFEISCPVK